MIPVLEEIAERDDVVTTYYYVCINTASSSGYARRSYRAEIRLEESVLFLQI